ncbi:hypothetical protein Scep_009953 [Stephania cephalantha]|uniref:Uncharacterized protein n=1 Tax=Stephania cephalantha TaxID=152367 RepID=A0AAP0PDL7_9MAGN
MSPESDHDQSRCTHCRRCGPVSMNPIVGVLFIVRKPRKIKKTTMQSGGFMNFRRNPARTEVDALIRVLEGLRSRADAFDWRIGSLVGEERKQGRLLFILL